MKKLLWMVLLLPALAHAWTDTNQAGYAGKTLVCAAPYFPYPTCTQTATKTTTALPVGTNTATLVPTATATSTPTIQSGWLSTAVTVALTPGTYAYKIGLPIISSETGLFANSVNIEGQGVSFGMIPVGAGLLAVPGSAYALTNATNAVARNFSPYLNTGGFAGSGPSSIIVVAVLATLTITPGTTINFIVTQRIQRGAYYRGGVRDRYCLADYEKNEFGVWKPVKIYIQPHWTDLFGKG